MSHITMSNIVKKYGDGFPAVNYVDPAVMHVFDPATGDNLTRNEAKAAEIAKDSDDDRRRALERAKQQEAAAAIR